jgi:energy-coupling factor transport system ATP-binding protein
VALAAILAMHTPILILDEPTTGQDAANIERIARIVQTLRERGQTVIAITHDIDFCAENFDRIIALSQGRILLDGPASRVLAHPDVLATTYVELPQLARLSHRLGLPAPARTVDEFLKLYREQK